MSSHSPQSLKGSTKRVLLVILDGFGLSEKNSNNAIRKANKPHLDRLLQHFPLAAMESGGEAVGLPSGVAGNSEVGHLNIGAGKPVRQDLVRINEAIAQGTFKDMPKMQELIQEARTHTKRVHLMGLLSDGGVHSHIDHLKEVIRLLGQEKDLQIYFHAFMDGRDTAPDKGIHYLQDILKEPGYKFASMQGRSIGMDRDRRWPKIELAYKTLIGQGSLTSQSPTQYLKSQYDQKILDEFITPVLFDKEGAIKSGDAVFFINFRPDRARQITLAFTDPKFKEFPTPVRPSYFLCMTPYVPDEVNLPILFDKERIRGGLAEYLSSLGLKQFKIAETEKYAHVTYFFNGGEEKPFPGEDRVLVPSPRDVATYDQRPEMSAFGVTEKLLEALSKKDYSLYVVNYANADMVGHTGNFSAAVKAIETLDLCMQKIMSKCQEEEVTMILTADHGNADQMSYEDGSPHTSHTNSKVPFALFAKNLENASLTQTQADPALKDIAPSILHLLGIQIPDNMTGRPVFS